MPKETIPITGAVLTWARLRSGFPLEELKATFRAIEEWEAETAQPTYPQLEQLSDKLKTPVAVFFFPEPPKVPPIRESFRTLPDAEFDQMPPSVRYMLRKASAMQMNLAEMNSGKNPSARLATRDLTFAESMPVATMASTVRSYLNVTLDQQIQWPTAEEALEQWRNALTRVGVFVFKDAFRSDDYSGFCLYDAEFPIIYVNNSMSKTRQIFTLFHELAHLIFHTSGIDTPSNDYVVRLSSDAKRIEVLANKFAGLFLVPEREFSAALTGLRRPESQRQNWPGVSKSAAM